MNVILVFSVFCFIGNTYGQNSMNTSDFIPIIGEWSGSLTYLDYTSGKPFTMPANIKISQIGTTNQYLFSNSFPEEPSANWADTVTISKDGLKLNDETITSKKHLPNGLTEIVTEVNGVDGNDKKPAILKHTYTVGAQYFSRRKDVKFIGETTWIKRHEYLYKK